MTRTILSIQSHVAYGHVGNAAAVFPLQRMGCEVIDVNTVAFSNHTGYGTWSGRVFEADHVRDVLDGVEARGGLAGCDAVLSGYVGESVLGEVVLDAVSRVRALDSGAVYCCDPVMGDVGRGFFVRPGVPEFMRDHAVPAADIVTPNRFELEYLTGMEVRTLDDALAATAALRARGPSVVLVTSLDREGSSPDRIEMLVDGADGAHTVETPRIPLDPAPNGAGDAVAAMFLAHWLETRDPASALARSAEAIHAVLEETGRRGGRELRLIEAQDALVARTGRFPTTRVRSVGG